jgi:predicted O-methyltransferase YrrM
MGEQIGRMKKHFGIVDARLEEYMESLLPPQQEVLADMQAQAEREGLGIIGPLQGHLLYTLALAVKAKDILEVGTAIGYSAMWLSMAAQQQGGRVVTVERDESRAAWAEAYMRQAGLSGVCAVRRGEALTLLRGMEESFDLIFLDVLTQFDAPDTALELLDLCIRRRAPLRQRPSLRPGARPPELQPLHPGHCRLQPRHLVPPPPHQRHHPHAGWA